jgi:hypothetical protein
LTLPYGATWTGSRATVSGPGTTAGGEPAPGAQHREAIHREPISLDRTIGDEGDSRWATSSRTLRAWSRSTPCRFSLLHAQLEPGWSLTDRRCGSLRPGHEAANQGQSAERVSVAAWSHPGRSPGQISRSTWTCSSSASANAPALAAG